MCKISFPSFPSFLRRSHSQFSDFSFGKYSERKIQWDTYGLEKGAYSKDTFQGVYITATQHAVKQEWSLCSGKQMQIRTSRHYLEQQEKRHVHGLNPN